MDLVAGVRKEGSRGGRDAFKWSDVKESSHRENYLGHSIMAPVGRWQQNRDLNWYAKTSDRDSADKAKREREEEIRRIKEAEQDAMALALGLPVAPRASNNANLTPLGGQEVRKIVQESTEGEGDGGRGIGFGSYGGVAGNDAEDEILAPIGMDSGARPLGQEKDSKDRGHRSRRDRSRNPDRRRDREHRDRGGRHRHDRDDRADREHRHRHHREHREHRRHRSRSRSVSRSPRPERRDRRPETDRRRDASRSGRHRSSSPRRNRDRGDHESGREAHHRHHRR